MHLAACRLAIEGVSRSVAPLCAALPLLVVLLTGCGPGSVPTATPTMLSPGSAGPTPVVVSEGVVAKITRSGGILGRTETIVIRADGTATFTGENRYSRDPKPFLVTESVVQDLETAFNSDEWQQLAKSHGECAQCADYYEYHIWGGGKTVIAREPVEKYPPPLRVVYDHAVALFRVVDCTGGSVPTSVPQPDPTTIADC